MVAYEWGRLIWWSGQNAAALQALTAIVVMFLTLVLIGIAWYYAGLTRQMALTMERQMASAFQPNVVLAFPFRAQGESSSFGVRGDDSIHANVLITNRGGSLLKLSMLSMRVVFESAAFESKKEDIQTDGLILAPEGSKEFRFYVSVPPNALGGHPKPANEGHLKTGQ